MSSVVVLSEDNVGPGIKRTILHGLYEIHYYTSEVYDADTDASYYVDSSTLSSTCVDDIQMRTYVQNGKLVLQAGDEAESSSVGDRFPVHILSIRSIGNEHYIDVAIGERIMRLLLTL